jgi:hypothetical protein
MNVYLIRDKVTHLWWGSREWDEIGYAFTYAAELDSHPAVVNGFGEFVQFCECPL